MQDLHLTCLLYPFLFPMQSITPKKERHPHDTSFLVTHSLSSSSSKKKRGRRRTPKLFGRRKKYLECEDDGEYEI